LNSEAIGSTRYLRAKVKRREAGASLVEYALLVALIALVCVAAVSILGSKTSASYSDFGSRVEAS